MNRFLTLLVVISILSCRRVQPDNIDGVWMQEVRECDGDEYDTQYSEVVWEFNEENNTINHYGVQEDGAIYFFGDFAYEFSENGREIMLYSTKIAGVDTGYVSYDIKKLTKNNMKWTSEVSNCRVDFSRKN